MKIDGKRRRQVHHEEAVVRRLPDAVQGHRQGQVARPHRRPAARLRDDRRVRREPPERRHRAGHRVSRRVQPPRHRRGQLVDDARRGCARRSSKGLLTAADLDGIDMRWGNGEGALALTIKMGTGEGCGAWLGQRRPARGRARRQGQRRVRGPRPRWRARLPRQPLHLADGRDVHRRSDAGPPHRGLRVVERDVRRRASRCPQAADKKDWNVKWKGTEGKGKAQALHSNAHQAMNGLGLCMFTMLTGRLPWAELRQRRDRLGAHRRRPARSAASGSRTCAPRSTAARGSSPPTSSRTRACSARATATSSAGPLKGDARAAAHAARRLLHRDALEHARPAHSREGARDASSAWPTCSTGTPTLPVRRASGHLRSATRRSDQDPHPDPRPHRRRLEGRRQAPQAARRAPRSSRLLEVAEGAGIPLREALAHSPAPRRHADAQRRALPVRRDTAGACSPTATRSTCSRRSPAAEHRSDTSRRTGLVRRHGFETTGSSRSLLCTAATSSIRNRRRARTINIADLFSTVIHCPDAPAMLHLIDLELWSAGSAA